MIKNINYSGYTAQPSDYESPDGQLAASLNLICEDGRLKPILRPNKILSLQSGESVLLIHSVPGRKNYILARPGSESSVNILWMEKEPDVADTTSATPVAAFKGLLDITAVGNTLVLALESGIYYLLWKDDSYIRLGNRPPFVSIDFGMCRVGNLSNSETFDIPARCALKATSLERGPASKSELTLMTEMVNGMINAAVADKVTSQGLFYQPFFVRYAYRLYDGSYSWHSAPVLMLPTVTPPIVKYSDDGSHPAEDETLKATFKLNINYFALAYRILTDAEAELGNWSDLVSGIDIFISAPIYTFNQSKTLTANTITPVRFLLTSLYDWNSRGLGSRDDNLVAPSSVFVGHYADNLNANYIDHTMSTADSDSFNVVNIRPHENFHNNIRHAHDFYKVAEIDFKDIKAMTSMERLKLTDSDMSSLVTREPMPDDYRSHCSIVASSLYAFNSRLNLADIKISPAEPFPLRSVAQFSNPVGSTAKCAKITVWTRLNGVKCYAVHIGNEGVEADIFHNPTSNFPRYLFYPDASAYKMEIFFSESQKFIINLTPHEFLNGAYYYSADFGTDPTPENAEPETAQCAAVVSIGSKIYTSEVNNPFYFPLSGINTVGSGRVLAISTAAKALSQGQFGQFPLYAFTDEGVWALEVSATGSYSARQPITRDVILENTEPLQMDSAVLFATERGVMLISGSQTQCITDTISSRNPFDLLQLPAMTKIISLLGYAADDTCLSLVPFREFMAQCGMLYDYVNQRVILYNPTLAFAYVYSLKSKEWGMMHSTIKAGVNSYPEALAVNHSGGLLNFSSLDGNATKGLMVTRPLKLDMSDVLKTIDTVIQRGHFRKGKVQTALYGSRDLYNWHLVWTSRDHYLRGFRGSPYKYYCIACVTSLGEDESLFGATVQFTPRLTDQPR